jgi:hypothetical protein
MHTDRNGTRETIDRLGLTGGARISARFALLVRAIILQVIHLERAKSICG